MSATPAPPCARASIVTNPIANARSAHLFRLAYVTTSAERAAILERDLLPVDRDVQAVVATMLDALPRLSALRDTTIADALEPPRLETYARALAYAHTVYLAASTNEALTAQATRALNVRADDRRRAYTLAVIAYRRAATRRSETSSGEHGDELGDDA